MNASALWGDSVAKNESCPLRSRPFECLFYVDVMTSPGRKNCGNPGRHREEMTPLPAVLGMYAPAGSDRNIGTVGGLPSRGIRHANTT